jgi:hypothetical protein
MKKNYPKIKADLADIPPTIEPEIIEIINQLNLSINDFLVLFLFKLFYLKQKNRNK